MKIGSLFSGYGGLEEGIRQVINADTAWHVEFDAAPSRILAHHWPTVPNYGDITTVNWSHVAPVDILTGGFPCQDVSLAGLRKGLHPDTRSGLWSHFALAIDALRPPLVIVENVRGLLSAQAASNLEPDAWGMGDDRRVRPPLRALGAVLGDLADLGYDAQWAGVRAADAGAPHGRFRVFLVAHPAHLELDRTRSAWNRRAEPADRRGTAPDADRDGLEGIGRLEPVGRDPHRRDRPYIAWGTYEPAIHRWEAITGRLAPAPTTLAGRLDPRFVEWLMGLEPGHVTDPAIGLTRNEQLKALGNGVVPQQAALALTRLLNRTPALEGTH